MKHSKYPLLLFMLLFFAKTSPAQTCPHGYMPLGSPQAGWTGCAPMSGPNENPPNPGQEWQTRWGAIALTDGAFGTSSNQPSKRLAKKLAIQECKANGGSKCTVKMFFYNQCAALAWGDARYVVYRTSRLNEAEAKAVEDCGEYTTNCRLFYSSCSYAKRIR